MRAGVFTGIAFTGISRVRDVIRRRSGLLYPTYRGAPAEFHPASRRNVFLPLRRAPSGRPAPAAMRPGRRSPMNLAAPGGTSC